MKKYLLIGLALLVVLFGCNLTSRDYYRTEDNFPENGKGMLVLILDSGEIPTIRTLEPDPVEIVMDADEFDIYFDGPDVFDGYELWESRWDSGVYSKNGVETGLYRVRVVAWNSTTNEIVGEINGGVAPNYVEVDVPENDIISANTTIIPIVGTGNIDVTVDWEAGAMSTPTMTAYLVPPTGDPTAPTIPDDEITFTINNTASTIGNIEPYSANYNATGLTTGYYTLIIYLYDGGLVWGHTESARIIDGETTGDTATSDAYDLTLSGAGGFTLSMDVDLHNPYTITFTLDSGTLPLASGASMEVTATAASLASTVPTGYYYTCQWFMDGSHIAGADTTYVADDTGANTASITYVNSGPLSSGAHNLSVLLTIWDDVPDPDVVHSISSNTYQFNAQ